MTAKLSKDHTIVWVVKLPDYISNKFLEGSDIENGLECFNPSPASIEFDDCSDELDTKVSILISIENSQFLMSKETMSLQT